MEGNVFPLQMTEAPLSNVNQEEELPAQVMTDGGGGGGCQLQA